MGEILSFGSGHEEIIWGNSTGFLTYQEALKEMQTIKDNPERYFEMDKYDVILNGCDIKIDHREGVYYVETEIGVVGLWDDRE